MTGRYSTTSRRGFLKRSIVGMGLAAIVGSFAGAASAEIGYPEKEDLKFGFIKLTDMAPLAIACEKGCFEDEGQYVTLEAQANWKVLLDGAHMLAGQPLAATIQLSNWACA